MVRYIGVFFVVIIAALYCFGINNMLVVYAKKNLNSVIVLSDKKGEELISIAEENLDVFLSKLNLQNCNKFYIEDRLVIEGYSSKFNNYILINNKKINVQISLCDGMCLIGSPIIKKSF